MSTACPRTLARQAGRLRFVTATPANVAQGSGTYVGIATLRRALEELGAEVELVAAPPGPAGTWRRLWFNWRLRRLPAGEDATIVGFDLDGLFLPRGKGRSIAALKGVRAEEARWERGWTRMALSIEAWLEAWRARRADAVVVTSRYAATAVGRRYGVAPERIRVVPELIDLAAWQELLARAPRRAHTRPTLLCVAHLYPRKDVATLLEAMAGLEANAELRIVGTGPERRRLERQTRRLGLTERVRFLGHIPRQALAREYRSADIFCLPSRQEGFGIVLLEAMAAGLPIVAARAAAIPEVVAEPEGGILFPPGDAAALRQVLVELLGDAARRQELAAAGLRRVRRYDAARVAGEFLAALGD
ncbi:MAG: glycosyltransferase family 4 protein [Terriglobales bacterium]